MTEIIYARSYTVFDWDDRSEWTEIEGTAFSRTYQVMDHTLTIVGNFGSASGMPDAHARVFLLELRNSSDEVLVHKSGFDTAFGNLGQGPEGADPAADYLLFRGSDSADYASGSDWDDDISGFGGNDELRGNDGSDVIDGGDGNDKIFGGGNWVTGDTITGGQGADLFVFQDFSEVSMTWNKNQIKSDRITDFEEGEDFLHFRAAERYYDWDRDKWARMDLEFIGRNKFSGDGEEIRVTHSLDRNFEVITKIAFDVEGSKKVDYVLVLDGRVDLSEADFIL